MNALDAISEITRIHLRPGDVLAFRVDEGTTAETAGRIATVLRESLPAVPVVVYTGGEFVVVPAEEVRR